MTGYLKLFATCNSFFACRFVNLGQLRLNIKARAARHAIPEFLNKAFDRYILSHSTQIGVEIFSLCTIFAHCSSSSSSAAHHSQKVRTENLKLWTDLQDRVMDDWSVIQKMIVYKDKLLKKSSNRKQKLVLSTLVTTWLSNITFHLRQTRLQTLVGIDSDSCQTSFPSICAPLSDLSRLLLPWQCGWPNGSNPAAR